MSVSYTTLLIAITPSCPLAPGTVDGFKEKSKLKINKISSEQKVTTLILTASQILTAQFRLIVSSQSTTRFSIIDLPLNDFSGSGCGPTSIFPIIATDRAFGPFTPFRQNAGTRVVSQSVPFFNNVKLFCFQFCVFCLGLILLFCNVFSKNILQSSDINKPLILQDRSDGSQLVVFFCPAISNL